MNNYGFKSYTRAHDLTGKQFGKWTVLKLAGKKKGQGLWLCRCQCGNENIVNTYNLMHGRSKGCKNCSSFEARKKASIAHFNADTCMERVIKSVKTMISHGIPLDDVLARLSEECGKQQSEEDQELLATRLADCCFSVRTMNVLRAADLETVGDLLKLNCTALLQFRNFGKKSQEELNDFVKGIGKKWGTKYLVPEYEVFPDEPHRKYIKGYKLSDRPAAW